MPRALPGTRPPLGAYRVGPAPARLQIARESGTVSKRGLQIVRCGATTGGPLAHVQRADWTLTGSGMELPSYALWAILSTNHTSERERERESCTSSSDSTFRHDMHVLSRYLELYLCKHSGSCCLGYPAVRRQGLGGLNPRKCPVLVASAFWTNLTCFNYQSALFVLICWRICTAPNARSPAQITDAVLYKGLGSSIGGCKCGTSQPDM